MSDNDKDRRDGMDVQPEAIGRTIPCAPAQKTELRDFSDKVNAAFRAAIGARLIGGAGGRRIVGIDGKVRERGMVMTSVDLADGLSDDRATAIGESLAKDVAAACPGATAIAHVTSDPVCLLGEMLDGSPVWRVPGESAGADDRLLVRIGCYFAAMDGDAPAVA